MQTELAPHPIAMLIPRPTTEEHAATRRSIAKDGLLEGMEIWTYPDNGEEKVLDGNTRQACCLEENIEPRYRPYTGDDPVGFVLAMNLSRRHLGNASARKKVAEALLKVHPEWSNRRIAHESGFNRTDVGDLRREIDQPKLMSGTDIRRDAMSAAVGDPERKPPEALEGAGDGARGSSEANAELAAGARSRSGARGEDDEQTQASAGDAGGSPAPVQTFEAGTTKSGQPRKARGRPVGSGKKETAKPPKEVKPKPLTDPRSEWISVTSARLKTDFRATVEDIANMLKDWHGTSALQRQVLARQLVAALGATLP
jgi:hypothetical protein